MCIPGARTGVLKMKSLVMALGVALIIASPAFAQTAKRSQARPVAAPQVLSNGPHALDNQTLVVDGQLMRDPDPQVRLEMQRSAPFLHGGD
jgi:hypothetical protein